MTASKLCKRFVRKPARLTAEDFDIKYGPMFEDDDEEEGFFGEGILAALRAGTSTRQRIEVAELPLGYMAPDGMWWTVVELPDGGFRLSRFQGRDVGSPAWTETFGDWPSARAAMEAVAPWAAWSAQAYADIAG